MAPTEMTCGANIPYMRKIIEQLKKWIAILQEALRYMSKLEKMLEEVQRQMDFVYLENRLHTHRGQLQALNHELAKLQAQGKKKDTEKMAAVMGNIANLERTVNIIHIKVRDLAAKYEREVQERQGIYLGR